MSRWKVIHDATIHAGVGRTILESNGRARSGWVTYGLDCVPDVARQHGTNLPHDLGVAPAAKKIWCKAVIPRDT